MAVKISGPGEMCLYPWQSVWSDSLRSYAAAPVRPRQQKAVPGALEGTKSGKDCSSSSAVEEASVPRPEVSVDGCVGNSPNWQPLFGDGSSRSSGTSRVGGATTKEGDEEGGGF